MVLLLERWVLDSFHTNHFHHTELSQSFPSLPLWANQAGSPAASCDKSKEGGCCYQFPELTTNPHCSKGQKVWTVCQLFAIFTTWNENALMIICLKIVILPHDPRLVFCKPLFHFISMVPLVSLHGLVTVLIELLSSLINGSHVFGLKVEEKCYKSSYDTFLGFFPAKCQAESSLFLPLDSPSADGHSSRSWNTKIWVCNE